MRAVAVALAVTVTGCGTPPARSTLAVPEATAEATLEPPPARVAPRGPTLTREAFDRTLDAGPGAFLGRVKVRAVMTGGRFVGWEVLEMDPAFAGGGVRVGDVVERVNGLSVEKPDDFAAAWQALRGVGAVELGIRRNGEESVVRIPVVE